MTFHWGALALALTLTLAACGARTGLGVPDSGVGPDAAGSTDVSSPAPPFANCTDGSFVLVARAADLILVIDRSGSMADRLASEGPGQPSKWSLLRNALQSTLPMFQSQIDVGALFFPETRVANGAAACTFAAIPAVDVAPDVGTAPAILGIFDSTMPVGATPTAAALLRAYTYFVRNPNRARARYLVLATDGGPNCNTALDPATCVCTNLSDGCNVGFDYGGIECLDAARTESELRAMDTSPVVPIPTFVIGLSDQSDPHFTDTLTSMAIAGGRPNRLPDGSPTFYDVRTPGELPTAFATIQNTIARCTFVTPSRPPPGVGSVGISVGGVTVPQDPTHTNGWDWTDRPFGELTLFGPACPASASLNTTATATVLCGDHGD